MLFEDHLTQLQSDSKKTGTQGKDLDFALLLDGLEAEREQGITIDVAYRFFTTEKRKFIAVDTPGHEQYTRNMITAASTAELAIILIDARKGINMFKKVNVPILGLVENMSYFICDNCEQKHHIFLSGGAKKEAENFNIRFLGELPLDKNLCIDSDRGKPVNIDNKNSSTSELFKKIAIDINNIVTS